MRIAIDASPLLSTNPTGVGRVVREVLREISRRAPRPDDPIEVFAVAPDHAPRVEFPADAKTKIQCVAIPTNGKNWRGNPAEKFVKENNIDIFWSTVSAFPRSVDCSTIATFHEAPWEVPGTRGDEGTGFNHRLWATLDAWFATRVVCPSQSAADGFLASHLRKSFKSKVVVINWGVSEHFIPELPKGTTSLVDNYKYRTDYPFFLMVAAPRRIKNFELTIRALKVFRDRYKVDARLFIVGPNGTELMQALGYADGLDLRQYVSAFDYVPELELAELYRRARATLVFSRSEGFGFPVLESMACGTPVLHSGRGALAETAGGAGLLVNIDDEEAIAAEMYRMHSDESARTDIINKGKAHAAKYKWSRTVDQLFTLFQELGGAVGAGAHGGHAH
ncbi:MAG: glycosyltransferase family 4 protein [Planctomycetota bacterium]